MGQWFPFILTWPAFLLYYGAVLIATGFTCWFGVALPIIGFFSLLNDSRRYPKALCPLVCGSVIYIPVAYLFWGNFCYFQFGRDMWAMFQIGVTVLAIVLGCLALGFCCNKANTVRKRRIRLWNWFFEIINWNDETNLCLALVGLNPDSLLVDDSRSSTLATAS